MSGKVIKSIEIVRKPANTKNISPVVQADTNGKIDTDDYIHIVNELENIKLRNDKLEFAYSRLRKDNALLEALIRASDTHGITSRDLRTYLQDNLFYNKDTCKVEITDESPAASIDALVSGFIMQFKSFDRKGLNNNYNIKSSDDMSVANIKRIFEDLTGSSVDFEFVVKEKDIEESDIPSTEEKLRHMIFELARSMNVDDPEYIALKFSIELSDILRINDKGEIEICDKDGKQKCKKDGSILKLSDVIKNYIKAKSTFNTLASNIK